MWVGTCNHFWLKAKGAFSETEYANGKSLIYRRMYSFC